MDPEEGLAGPVANQQGLNLHVATDKNQQVKGEPSTSQAHEDSGCYSIHVDQSTSDQAQNGGSMSKREVETSGKEEQQDYIAVKWSEAVLVELPSPLTQSQRPCKVKDDIPSVSRPVTCVSQPPVSESEDTTTNVQEMATPLQGIQDKNAELGMPLLDTQHNASGGTLRVSSDKTVSLKKTVEEPNLEKLHSRKVAIQERFKAIETRMHEKRYNLVDGGQDVDPATLDKILRETCQEMSGDMKRFLSILEMTKSPTFSECAPGIRRDSPDIEDPKAADTNLSVSPRSSLSNIPSPAEMTESPAFSESASNIRKGSPNFKDPEAVHKNLSVSTTSRSSSTSSPTEDQGINSTVEEQTEKTAKCPESVPKDDKKPEMLKGGVPESMVLETKNTQGHSNGNVQEVPNDIGKEELHLQYKEDLSQRQQCSESPRQREEPACTSVELMKEHLGDLVFDLGQSDSGKNENKQPESEGQKGMPTEDRDRKKRAGDKMSKKKEKAQTKSGDKKEDGVLSNKPLSKRQAKKERKDPGEATNSLVKKEKSEERVKNVVPPAGPVKKGQEKNQMNKSEVAPNNKGKNGQSKKVPSNMQEKRGESAKSKAWVLCEDTLKEDHLKDVHNNGVPSNTKVKSSQSGKSGVMPNNPEKEGPPKNKTGNPSNTQVKRRGSEETGTRRVLCRKSPKEYLPEDRDEIENPPNKKVKRREHHMGENSREKPGGTGLHLGGSEKGGTGQKSVECSGGPHRQPMNAATMMKVKKRDAAKCGVLHNNRVTEGHQEDKDKSEVPWSTKSGDIEKKDRGKNTIDDRKQEKNPGSKRGDSKTSTNLEAECLIRHNDDDKKYDLTVQTPGNASLHDSHQTLLEDTKALKINVSIENWMNLKKSSLGLSDLMPWSHKEEPKDLTSYYKTTGDTTRVSVEHDAPLVYNVQCQDEEDMLGDGSDEDGEEDQDDYNPPEHVPEEDDNFEDVYSGSEDYLGAEDTVASPEPTAGMTVTVMGPGEQVVSETTIHIPTTLQQHILDHTADRAFAKYEMDGFTVKLPGGHIIHRDMLLDPQRTGRQLPRFQLQLHQANPGDSTWEWRVIHSENPGGGRYAVEENHADGRGEARAADDRQPTEHVENDRGSPNALDISLRTLEEQIQRYRRIERGMTVTVMGPGEQVVSHTPILNPTTLQKHILEHTAHKAFEKYPMDGFTVKLSGGGIIPCQMPLDPWTNPSNITFELHQANSGDDTWWWRVVENLGGGRYAVQVKMPRVVARGEARATDDRQPTEDVEKGVDCCICLDTCTDSEMFEALCGHHFHWNCLPEWQQENDACPLCGKKKPGLTRQ